MDSTFQVLKAGWKITKTSDNLGSKYEAKPYILIRNLNESVIERFYFTANQELRFFVTEDQYCIGFEPERGKWLTCPNNTKTTGSDIQCPSCKEVDFFSCRKTCQGFRCLPKTPQAKAICDKKETYLYLTYVGGKFKVGVTLNPIRRWIEQGSLYGSLIYKGYGLESRLYEHTIGTTLDLKMAVSTNEKITSLGTKLPSRSQIKQEFSNYFASIKKLNLFKFETEPFLYNLTKYYQNIPLLDQKPLVDNKLIKGKVVGVIGRLLVVKDKNSLYATNLKELLGRILTKEKPTSGTYSKQRTIYDY